MFSETTPVMPRVDHFKRERSPGVTRIPANAASRVRDRVNHTLLSRDWGAMRACAGDELVFDDRRRWSLLSGGVDLWIKSCETIQTASGLAISDELIGTVGDRIELRRRVLTGTGPDGGDFESELILLTEATPDGRLVASINFDVEARAEAFADAQDRFLAGEAAAVGGQVPLLRAMHAFARRDWELLRGCFVSGAGIADRRATADGGELDRDHALESWRAFADRVPDVHAESPRILMWNAHGRVAVIRLYAATPGGEPFDDVVIGVFWTEADRIRRCELYDPDDADTALTGFAERRSPGDP